MQLSTRQIGKSIQETQILEIDDNYYLRQDSQGVILTETAPRPSKNDSSKQVLVETLHYFGTIYQALQYYVSAIGIQNIKKGNLDIAKSITEAVNIIIEGQDLIKKTFRCQVMSSLGG